MRRNTLKESVSYTIRGECLLKMTRIDRISDLPDSLLHHIMSFLESREVVQTCVLSKSWKNLWASLQCLYLNMSNFEAGENINKRFMNFVNTLLLLRDTSDLHRFRVICDYDDAHVFHWPVMTWFLYAIKRNAKVIEIDFIDYERLPQCVFNSETLEDLNLCICSIDKGIGSRTINLPRLKKLKLCARSDDNDILNKLALGCPALEYLHLITGRMNVCVVSFPKLKYLNLCLWGEDTWVECIRAPNLVSLVLDGCAELFKKTSFEKMPSLMNATISLRSWYSFYVEKCNMLHAVANVQNLELSWSTIQALIKIELSRCPTLFNLTTLSLRYFCMICHSNEIGDILKRTPNLKKLILCGDNVKKHECDLEADQGSNSIKSPLFQCENLDEIEVELKCINVITKQLVYTLVESLAELKTTRLILSFHYNWPCSPSLSELHQFCLSMVQGKNVLTLLSGNKFIVWSK